MFYRIAYNNDLICCSRTGIVMVYCHSRNAFLMVFNLSSATDTSSGVGTSYERAFCDFCLIPRKEKETGLPVLC